MPHQCTECGRTFPDGSKEMLSGCPDCGGNKFQFDPGGASDDAPEPDATPPDRPGEGSVAGRVGRATATVKRWVSGSDDSPDRASSTTESPPSAPDTSSTPESPATPQTSASADTTGADDASDAAADAEGADDRAYGEWPNPDDADTAGVGKGPEDRRNRSTAAEEGEERPDADDRSGIAGETEAAGDVEDPADAAPPTDHADEVDDPSIDAAEAVDEDSAQATARTDVVSPNELPDDPPDSGTLGPRRTPGPGGAESGTAADDPSNSAATPSGTSAEGTDAGTAAPNPESGRVASEPADDDRPDLEDLREELNDQFESIKILEPGQYELNLMELYDREEYIISLQEDGRYVIEVPERWRDEE